MALLRLYAGVYRDEFSCVRSAFVLFAWKFDRCYVCSLQSIINIDSLLS